MLGKLLKDMVVYAPSRFLPALTAFVTTPILTRLFPPDEYGYWALALSIASFLVALSVDGLGSAVIRFYPAYRARGELSVFFATVGASIGAAIIAIGALACLILFVMRSMLPPALVRLLPLVVLIFIAQGTFNVFIAVMRAEGRSASFTSFQLFANYGGLGAGLLLVVAWGYRVDGLMWGAIVAMVVALPVLVHMGTKGVGIHTRQVRFRDALEIWQYAWPLTLGNVAMWGLRVSDLFVIGTFRPERDVGLYSVSYNISAKSIELLVGLFLLSVSPLVYTTWETEGREATERALATITRVYLIVCLPAAVGLAVLASPFVGLLASSEYHEGYRVVGLVGFSSFAWGLANIAMMGIAIKKQALRLGGNQIVAACTHIGLMLVLVPRFGFVAAGATTLIGYSVLFVLQALGSRAHLTWRFPTGTLQNVAFSSAVMGVAAWWVCGKAGDASKVSPANLLLGIAVAVMIYASCLWGLGEISAEEKDAVIQIWHSVTRRVARVQVGPRE